MPSISDAPPRFWLRFRDNDIPLRRTWVVIGRSPVCDLVLEHEMISRRHARIGVIEAGVVVEDLSTNGVFIGGQRIQGQFLLTKPGKIAIGPFELEVVDNSEVMPIELPGMPDTITTVEAPLDAIWALDEDELAEAASQVPGQVTAQADAIGLLETTAEKLITDGKPEMAVRLMSTRLLEVAKRGRELGKVDRGLAIRAADWGLRLAEAAKNARWVEYAIVVATINPELMPNSQIDRLAALAKAFPAIRGTAFRAYVVALEKVKDRFSPDERQLYDRLRALEKSMSTR